MLESFHTPFTHTHNVLVESLGPRNNFSEAPLDGAAWSARAFALLLDLISQPSTPNGTGAGLSERELRQRAKHDMSNSAKRTIPMTESAIAPPLKKCGLCTLTAACLCDSRA